jgi:hypothetical protein
MTSERKLHSNDTDDGGELLGLPPIVLMEVQALLASLIEGRHPLPDLDNWHVAASQLDVVVSPSVRAAWLVTVVDQASRGFVGSSVIFEPREGEVAA